MRYYAILIILFLAMTGWPIEACADTSLLLQEQEIKAGLLYNFLKYIDWPPGSPATTSSSVTVCVFGSDPFSGYLQPMAGRTVNQRKIEIRNIHDIQDISACQLLYVNADEKERWPELMKIVAGKNVLTVGDFTDFTATGGMIEFGLKDDHINVRLNTDSVTAARLHVQDRLLKLVTIVHSGGP
jgi:hypothetical protein